MTFEQAIRQAAKAVERFALALHKLDAAMTFAMRMVERRYISQEAYAERRAYLDRESKRVQYRLLRFIGRQSDRRPETCVRANRRYIQRGRATEK